MRAEALLRRQLALVATTAAVLLVLLAAVGVALSLSSARSQGWVVGAAVVSSGVAVVVLAVLVRHVVRLASFAFRKEVR
jgi:hypothetical protein